MPQTRPPRVPAPRPLWTPDQSRLAYWGRQFPRVLRRLPRKHLEGQAGLDEYYRRRDALVQHLGLDAGELHAVFVAEEIETLLQGRLPNWPDDWRDHWNPVEVERFGYHLVRDDPRTLSISCTGFGGRVVESLRLHVLLPSFEDARDYHSATLHVSLSDYRGDQEADFRWHARRARAIRSGLEADSLRTAFEEFQTMDRRLEEALRLRAAEDRAAADRRAARRAQGLPEEDEFKELIARLRGGSSAAGPELWTPSP